MPCVVAGIAAIPIAVAAAAMIAVAVVTLVLRASIPLAVIVLSIILLAMIQLALTLLSMALLSMALLAVTLIPVTLFIAPAVLPSVIAVVIRVDGACRRKRGDGKTVTLRGRGVLNPHADALPTPNRESVRHEEARSSEHARESPGSQ